MEIRYSDVLAALAQEQGDIGKAASVLGVSKWWLVSKLAELGLLLRVAEFSNGKIPPDLCPISPRELQYDEQVWGTSSPSSPPTPSNVSVAPVPSPTTGETKNQTLPPATPSSETKKEREAKPTSPQDGRKTFYGWEIREGCKSNYNVDFYVMWPHCEHMLRLAAVGYPIYLLGPAGTGKSLCPKWIGSQTHREVVVDCAGGIKEPEDLRGGMGLKNGESVMMSTNFIDAVQNGKIYVLDEFSRLSSECRNAILSVLENMEKTQNSHLVVGRERVPIHKDFRFFATGNPMEYAGNTEADVATNSRLVVFNVPYLPEKSEVKLLLHDVPGLAPDYALRMVKCANEIRKAKRDAGKITLDVSPRLLRVWGTMVVMGIPPEVAYETAIINQLDPGAIAERQALVEFFCMATLHLQIYK